LCSTAAIGMIGFYLKKYWLTALKYSLNHYLCSPIDASQGFVAQLDRAPDYGSGGLGFESLRDRKSRTIACSAFFMQKKVRPPGRTYLQTPIIKAGMINPALFSIRSTSRRVL
jgi:hypothetical protein